MISITSISIIAFIIGAFVVILIYKLKAANLFSYQKDEITKSNEELRKLLHIIQEQSEKLALQNEKLEELNKEKDSFVSVIAHDLKSPLNKALGLASILPLCGPVNDEQKEILEKINKVCHDGNQLINDLLVINQVESSQVGMNFTCIRLPNFIEEIIGQYQAQASQKQLQLLFYCDSPTTVDVVTDETYLRRIVDNLLSNAIKFSSPGGIVSISLNVDDQKIRLSVKDQGQGIRQEEMPYLFKKFKKLSARPTGGETSTGLGLSIAKMLTDRLKGTIAVESTWGKGSTFTLNLPVVP